MKKILSATLAFMLFAGAAQAQSKDSTKHDRKEQRASFESKMQLTEDQKVRMKAIREEQRKEMETLKKSTLSKEESISKRKELHKKYNDQVSSVLTSEQKERLAKLKAERKSAGKEGRKGMKGQGRDGKKGFNKEGRTGQDLNLTEDQKKKMTELKASSKSGFESIRNDKSLSDEQKKEKMKALKTEHHAQMKSILTKEQIEKMEAKKKEHKSKAKKN